MWKVTVHPKADQELKSLRYEHPGIFDCLFKAFRLLEAEDNPLDPVNPKLDVCKLRNMKPWARLRPTKTCRVAFRLLQSDRGEPIREIYEFEIKADAKRRVIQIMMVTCRDNGTYERIQGRHDAVHY